jgi:hypothetical protein
MNMLNNYEIHAIMCLLIDSQDVESFRLMEY